MHKLEIKELNMQDTRQHLLETYSGIYNKVKWNLGADWITAAGAYPGFWKHEVARSISTPSGQDASPPQIVRLPLPIYTPGWRDVPSE